MVEAKNGGELNLEPTRCLFFGFSVSAENFAEKLESCSKKIISADQARIFLI